MKAKRGGGEGKGIDRGKGIEGREEKKGSQGGGTTQHTKFIMVYVLEKKLHQKK